MRPAAFSARRALLPAAGWRRACLLIGLLFVAAQAGFALEITTTDGHTYHQVEIEKVEPDALRITHADGVARIPYEKLPEALQKQYFDPAKVAAYRQQFAIKQQEAAAKAAEAERLREEAAARAAEEQRQAAAEQAAERQRQAEEQQAAVEAAEGHRLAAWRHKMHLTTGLLIAASVVASFLYFLPTIIARHKANALAIFVFNLFFGWSGIGWIAALIWACTSDSAMDILAREQLNRQRAGNPPPAPNSGPYNTRQLPSPGPGQGQLDDQGRYLE